MMFFCFQNFSYDRSTFFTFSLFHSKNLISHQNFGLINENFESKLIPQCKFTNQNFWLIKNFDQFSNLEQYFHERNQFFTLKPKFSKLWVFIQNTKIDKKNDFFKIVENDVFCVFWSEITLFHFSQKNENFHSSLLKMTFLL